MYLATSLPTISMLTNSKSINGTTAERLQCNHSFFTHFFFVLIWAIFFGVAGREKGTTETYTDCFDFVYDGPRAQLAPNMSFKMQNGKDDRVCSKLGGQCKKNSGGEWTV